MELTVCIIDDDLVSQFATVYCLEQANVNCGIITCDSGKDGLALFSDSSKHKANLPNIILLDLVMPEMSGWEFLEKLKQIEGNWRQPDIYILSAFTNSMDRERAKHHPMVQGYFDKPLSKSILEKTFSKKLN